MAKFAQILPGILLVYSSPAGAVGWKTQMNCASDYYAYCSNFAVGSADVRRCMKSNGPRLSKGCVEALIADGEISRSEVGRVKEAASSAKTDGKADPTKLAANPQKPKPNDTRQATLSIAPARSPRPQVAIDDRMVAALQNRTHFLEDGAGDVLLARDTNEKDRTEQTLSRVEPSGDPPRLQPMSGDLKDGPATQVTKSGGDTPSETPQNSKSARTQRTQVAGEPRRPAVTTTGKMSVGRNTPPEEANGQDPAEAWNTYMQNRFSGSMNYEGLGARFSKGP
jgi:hypothetical protein